MDKYLYTCHYCGKNYKPKRRHKQRFCRNSCRVNAFNLRKKNFLNEPKNELSLLKKEEKNEQKISMAGIGNAAIANVATDVVKTIFTKEENKPATKGDLLGILSKIQSRFMPVINIPNRSDGARAFYDSETESVVFRHHLPKLKIEENKKSNNFQFF